MPTSMGCAFVSRDANHFPFHMPPIEHLYSFFFRFTLAVHVCIQLRHSSLIFFRSINNPVCPYENTVCPNSGSTFHRNSPLPLVIMPLNRRGCFPTPMRASLFPPHIQFFYGVFFFRCLWIFLCFSFYIFIFLSFCFVPS